MTATDETANDASMRRVRPVYAALLTLFFGWGMGFFYAGRTRAAIGWTFASFLLSIALLALIFAFPMAVYAPLLSVLEGKSLLTLLLSVLISLPAAALVWTAATRRPFTQKHSPLRLIGYLLMWVTPLIAIGALRFATVQPFRIPSGAMQPTVHIGDYIVVQKWSYGYSRFSIAPFEGCAPAGRVFAHQPLRGDIIVFRPVPDPDHDFIKRVIGLPGDRIQMIDGSISINGQLVPRQAVEPVTVSHDGVRAIIPAFRETLSNGVSYVTLDRGDTELDNIGEVVVPPGHYFVMGDDRDNSADSRVPSVVGMVPFDNFVGRVSAIVSGPNSR